MADLVSIVIPSYAPTSPSRSAILRITRTGMEMGGATGADDAAVAAHFYSPDTGNPTASVWLVHIGECEVDCVAQNMPLSKIDAT